MWIKTRYGDYINMDHASFICKHQDGITCAHINDSEYVISDDDVRDEIIRNIISGTKVMEVQ